MYICGFLCQSEDFDSSGVGERQSYCDRESLAGERCSSYVWFLHNPDSSCICQDHEAVMSALRSFIVYSNSVAHFTKAYYWPMAEEKSPRTFIKYISKKEKKNKGKLGHLFKGIYF